VDRPPFNFRRSAGKRSVVAMAPRMVRSPCRRRSRPAVVRGGAMFSAAGQTWCVRWRGAGSHERDPQLAAAAGVWPPPAWPRSGVIDAVNKEKKGRDGACAHHDLGFGGTEKGGK